MEEAKSDPVKHESSLEAKPMPRASSSKHIKFNDDVLKESDAIDNKCDIMIQLQNDDYNSGALIRGYIFLILHEEYHGDELHLILSGKEECSWRRSSSIQASTRSSSITSNVSHGKRDILKVVSVLQRFEGGMIKPGTYQYPFEIQLPEELPTSFTFIKANVRAMIKYKIKGVMRSLDKTATRLIRKQVINIKNKDAKAVGEISQDFPLSTCWCIKRGMFRLTVKADGDGTFVKGETANFTLTIDNTNSRLKVSTVTCSLVYEIELHTKMGGSYKKEEVLQKKEIGGVPSGKESIGLLNFELKDQPLKDFTIKTNTDSKLIKLWNYVDFRVTFSSLESVHVDLRLPIYIKPKPVRIMKKKETSYFQKGITGEVLLEKEIELD